jgi:hypothetical protein
MSHRRRSWLAVAVSVGLCATLSGCFGSGGTTPTAAHRHRHHRTVDSSPPTESPSTSSPTRSTTPPATQTLDFSPPSHGKHTTDCERLQPGDDPAEFLFYPVVVTSPTAVTLQGVATEHTQGVVDAGAWVAPAGSTPETGTFKGWPPPKIVTGDPNLQWGKKVPVDGARLDPGVAYNVFLRLQVDPTPGDSKVTGIDFSYVDSSGSSTAGLSDVWKAKTTFSMSC